MTKGVTSAVEWKRLSKRGTRHIGKSVCQWEGVMGIESFGKYRRLRYQLSRKAASNNYMLPVPRTNTRGQGEYPKVSERIVVKELCKITP